MSHWVTVFKKRKSLSRWVTVFKKKNVCHTESLCLTNKWSKTVKNCQKRVENGPFLTGLDSFWSLLTVFFLKHSESVWQTFFCIEHRDSVWLTFFSLTQWLSVTIYFFTQLSFSSCNFILEKIRKFGYLSKTNFNIEDRHFFKHPGGCKQAIR